MTSNVSPNCTILIIWLHEYFTIMYCSISPALFVTNDAYYILISNNAHRLITTGNYTVHLKSLALTLEHTSPQQIAFNLHE